MQLGLTVVSLLDDFRGSRFSRLFTDMLMLAGAFGVECGELDCARISFCGTLWELSFGSVLLLLLRGWSCWCSPR